MEIPISQRLKRWRDYRDMTLKELADASGLHVSSIHRMEHGQQEPKHSDLVALAAAFKVTVAELYALTPGVARVGGEAA